MVVCKVEKEILGLIRPVFGRDGGHYFWDSLLSHIIMDFQLVVQKYATHSRYFRNLSEETIQRNTRILLRFSKECGIDTLHDIQPEVVKEYFYRGRRELNWKSSTHLVYHWSFKVFIDWNIKEGYLDIPNFMNDFDLPRLEKRIAPKLSKQQAQTLLNVVRNYPYQNCQEYLRARNHAIIATFIFTGLRRSELLNLTMTDVDLVNLTILVRQGKGKKDRSIPISYDLVDVLHAYLKERKKLKRTCPYFFASSKKNVGFTKTGLKRLVRKIRSATGFHFTIHQLRHSFATLMMMGGCDLVSLQILMGHSDIKTTRQYLDASVEHLRDQMWKHPLSLKNLN